MQYIKTNNHRRQHRHHYYNPNILLTNEKKQKTDYRDKTEAEKFFRRQTYVPDIFPLSWTGLYNSTVQVFFLTSDQYL